MKSHSLSVEPREVLGKKVKTLRKKGLIPGNIYGKTTKSTAISTNSSDFKNVYEEAGETGLIELKVTGAKTPHHVLVHNVQIHAVSGEFIHVDFHAVALKEKITVAVPVTFTGESPASSSKKGVLLTLYNELEVSALPMDLPEEILVDISPLKEIGDEIKVSDLKVDSKITFVTDKDAVVARINPLEKEEAPAPVVASDGTKGQTPAADGKEAEAKPEAGKPAPAKEEKKKE